MGNEVGRCVATECYSSQYGDYITCDSNYCTFGNCSSSLMQIPASVPIKTTIQGLNYTPFVVLRFEGTTDPDGNPVSPSYWDYTQISTGNLSQPFTDPPDCSAVIKSFQYSYGTTESGNTCKIGIIDEKGSSLEKWFQRLFKNTQIDQVNTPQGVYKMKVIWGWVVAGEDGECPASMDFSPPGFFEPTPSVISVIPNNIPINNSTTPTRLIASPACWFLPDILNVSYQGNKIYFEITGIDLLQRSSEQPLSLTIGSQQTDADPNSGQKHFVDAVIELAQQAMPPFTVRWDANNVNLTSFKQINESTGVTEPMKFWVPSGTTGADLDTKGPKGIWSCHETTPFQTIRNWMNSHAVKADTAVAGSAGKGITMTFDPLNRELLFWSDAHPSCGYTIDIEQRLKACYITSGKCSPVLSFTPTSRYNFHAAAAAGGLSTPITGTQSKMQDQMQYSGCFVQGRNNKGQPVPAGSTLDNMGEGAGIETTSAFAAHRRATFLQYTIEAELRVQGDPSDFLCSPLFGYGKSVAIVVTNPFYLTEEDEEFCGWSQLTDSSCNTVFTNPAWFILGVDHQIKDGSYVTTYKLALFPAGNAEVNAGTGGSQGTTLGATTNIPSSFNQATFTVCNQGTFPCVEEGHYLIGANDGVPFPTETSAGAYVFCFPDCSGFEGVT